MSTSRTTFRPAVKFIQYGCDRVEVHLIHGEFATNSVNTPLSFPGLIIMKVMQKEFLISTGSKFREDTPFPFK